MNFSRKTIFWIITLVFLAGAFHLFDKKVAEDQAIAQKKLLLFPFAPDDVTEFWITKTKDKSVTRLVRDGENWNFTEPLAVKGDSKAIGKLLTNILHARKDAILFDTAEPDKLRELGLDKPELEMGFKATGGKSLIIRFGDMGPTHNIAYAQFKDDPRVLRIHSAVKQEADKSVYALRDKIMLNLDPLYMVKMEMVRKGMPKVVIRHKEGRWDMIEPTLARASMEDVLRIMYSVKSSEIKAFIDAPSGQQASYGLLPPRIKLTVTFKDQKEPYVLLVGAKDRKRRGYFAKLGNTGPLFVIEEDLLPVLMVSDDKLREGDPL
jgi:hypothetical protein